MYSKNSRKKLLLILFYI